MRIGRGEGALLVELGLDVAAGLEGVQAVREHLELLSFAGWEPA